MLVDRVLADVRAELRKQVRRPAHWLLLGVAVVLTLTFAYVIPYLGYTGRSGERSRGLESMLPAELVGNTIAGTPVFVGALALIFGVLVVGGEYGWQTWKTVLAQGSPRLRVFAAKVVVTTLGSLVLVLALLATGAAAGLGVALLQGAPITWPSLPALLVGAGGGWLITTMWAMAGVLLAVALRGVALPIGLGLVWLLAVQNLLSAVAAPLVDWIASLQKVLPGPNAGSLVSALGAPSGTPGVSEVVGAGQGAVVVACYLVVFTVVGGFLLWRRDIE
ncbi:ABC transporter permease subunit [Prauserella cavernicola]|uniref:ABC transporter permease subunit n=1 Tax=Prauserella cavernicola TaxID=2800127 RepID=A0A934V3H2_9PSEU|nr:ABC transporter permease subunit [Prauserella cavernicola]MBK1783010.1 ABC transporter permease subunit [Prauserella cavernicola]